MTELTTSTPAVRPQDWFRELGRFIIRTALWVLGIYVVWRVRGILADVVVASVIAVALVRIVDLVCRVRIKGLSYRTRRLIATLLVFVVFIFVIVEAVTLIIQPFEQSWQALRQALPQHEARVMHWIAAAKHWYEGLPQGMRDYLSRQGANGSSGSGAGEWAGKILGGAFAGISKIVDIVVLPVLAFYFVMDGHSLKNEFLALIPRPRRREAVMLMREASSIMHTFVVAQFWLCLIAGVVVYVGLKWIGLGQYAPVLGLLAGITRAIPIIGPVIGGIPIIGVALIVGGDDGVLIAIKVLVFFSIMHLVESKLIMPKFIGHRIHLHAALVILVLLIGYEFFGLLGMFLAAPVAAFCRVLILHYVIAPRRRPKSAAIVPEAGTSLLLKA